MIRTLNGNSNPQPSFGVQASTVPIFTPQGKYAVIQAPVQIIGFVPLVCPDQDPRLPPFSKCDCREWINDDCYINPVFASTSDSARRKNDRSYFYMEFPWFYQYQWSNPTASLMSLEEWNGTMWVTTTTLVNNTYGTFYDFGDLCIPNWKGFMIDWRKVIIAFGEGLYRFKISFTMFTLSGTRVSEPYCLKEWSCEGVDVTVRWEAQFVGGRVGSITDDQRVFELCCLNVGVAGSPQKVTPVTLDDEVRVYAFFGREKTEYERVNVEYQNGEIVQVRNEAIQKFEYESALQPKWLHDRLKAYGMMADYLYVSDYNWNNADYEIDHKRVVCDGSYEPEYHEDTRYSFVKVPFKEGFQNVIRDKCCNVTTR